LLLGYAFMLPGKKLMFMGSEFGSEQPWHHDGSLDWPTAKTAEHAQVQRWVRNLNGLYASHPALHEDEDDPNAFEWIDCHDDLYSVVSFARRSSKQNQCLLAVCNFMTTPQSGFRLGAPIAGQWKEIINSDSTQCGGTGLSNAAEIATFRTVAHGRPQSIEVTLPALSIVLFEHQL
jgi:1,4-alpha-glucan branching enzyme